jgi:hypothetical protein
VLNAWPCRATLHAIGVDAGHRNRQSGIFSTSIAV